jgi:hypothetical protein
MQVHQVHLWFMLACMTCWQQPCLPGRLWGPTFNATALIEDTLSRPEEDDALMRVESS